MPSNNSKYTPEFREQTARHIVETGKSATSMAEDLSIDVNTVCRWVREFRKKHDLPSWTEERKRSQKSERKKGRARKACSKSAPGFRTIKADIRLSEDDCNFS